MHRASRFRLIDGVVVAAVALLALKMLAFLSARGAPAGDGMDRPDLPAFARVLAHARTNYEVPDVTSTGSTGAAPHVEAKVPETKAPEPPVEALPPRAPPISPAERLLLEKLGERRDELRQRATETEQRQRLIEESERRLDQRLEELKASQQKTEAASERRSDDSEALKNLVTMYEAMKPKEAAKVFDRLPQGVLVAVVTQMKPRKMSEVLAAMSPASAEKLTVALASRGREPAAGPAGALPAGELPAIEPAASPRR